MKDGIILIGIKEVGRSSRELARWGSVEEMPSFLHIFDVRCWILQLCSINPTSSVHELRISVTVYKKRRLG